MPCGEGGGGCLICVWWEQLCPNGTMRIIFSLEWPPSAKLLLESPDGVIKPLQSAQMSERFSKLKPNSERWEQSSKKNKKSAFQMLLSFQNVPDNAKVSQALSKGSQLSSNESQRLSIVCRILSKVSQRENAALASTAPGSCCLCATLSILCHILLQYNSATLSHT